MTDSGTTVTMVQLPGLNTPQLTWGRTKLDRQTMPGAADLPAGGRGGRDPLGRAPPGRGGGVSGCRRHPRAPDVAGRTGACRGPHRRAGAGGGRLRAGADGALPLDEEPLPVAPGDYELMATITGVPKLRTIRTPVSVVGSTAGETPSPQATDVPEPSPTSS